MSLVKFYNGIETIGGISISFSDNEHRIIFGFGITPRNSNFVVSKEFKDKILDKCIPLLDGVYKKEYLDQLDGDIKLKSYDEFGVKTSVFITHGHPDHMGMIEYLDPNVDLYVNCDAYNLFSAIKQCEERNPKLILKEKVNFFEYDIPINIGAFEVTPFPVDHNTISPVALMIKFDGKTLVYTGDFYLNGKHMDHMEETIKKIQGVDILISESTAFSFLSSEEQENKFFPIATNEIITPTYGKSLDGFQKALSSDTINIFIPTIYNIEYNIDIVNYTQSKGITLVVLPDLAYVLSKFGIKDVPVLLNDETKGVYYDLGLDNPVIRLEELNKVDFLCVQGNANLIETLAKNNNTKKLKVLKCDPDKSHKIKPLIEKYHLKLISLTFSGHCSIPNLLYVIQQINPKQLMAMHSFSPEKLLEIFEDKALPARKNYSYAIENQKLVQKGEFYGKGYLVSCDLDGTLYINNTLDTKDLDAILKYKSNSKDNIFMMNTGRTLPSLLDVLKDFSINVDYFSCSNGAIIFDSQHKKIIEYPIPNDSLLNLFKTFSEITSSGDIRVNLQYEDEQKLFDKINNTQIEEIIKNISDVTIGKVLSIFITLPAKLIKPEQLNLLKKVLELESYTYYVEGTCESMIELLFTKKGIHKGTALNFIQKLTKTNTTTHIGDHFNDKGGFCYSDRPFLVGDREIPEGFFHVSSVKEGLEILSCWR